MKRRGCLNPNQALRTLAADPDSMFKLGVGGTFNAICLVLSLASPFCAPVVFAFMALNNGYVLKTVRQLASKPDERLPAWNGWLELFISGLTWLAVQFGLCLILISVVTVSLIVGENGAAIKMSNPHFMSWLFTSTTLTAGTWVGVSFFSRFLMINFALEERVQAGFAVSCVLRRAWRNLPDFLCAWLIGLGLQWIAILIPAVTVIGVFLVPSTLFVSDILAAIMAAQVWNPQKQGS